jgi:LysM domain
MMQESGGCSRAPTTNYGVRNPGVMQSHNGAGTCNDKGVIQTPCPAPVILQMVRDGAAGTDSGHGLVQLLQQSSGSEASRYYQAARKYNSGSVDPSGDLGAGIATHCYSSDVANRLTGWVRSRKTCNLDGAGDSSSAPIELPEADTPIPFDYSERGPASVPQPTPIPSPRIVSPSPAPVAPVVPQVAPPAPKPAVAPPAPLQRLPQRVQATSNKMAPGVTTSCANYYRVQDGDFCHKVAGNFGITFAQLRTLNTGLDATCSNLWKDYDYCVEPL